MPLLDTYSTTSWTAEQIRRLNDAVFDVRNYGAVGDGSTNCRTAFNDAITAANAAGGGVVFVPEGTWNIDGGTIVNLGGVTMQGVYAKSIIKTGWVASSSVQLFGAANATNVAFYDLVFDGNQSILSNTLNVGQFFNVQYLTLERCRFQNCKGIALLLSTNMRYVKIDSCEFVDCGVYPTFGPGGGKQAIAFSESTLGNTYDNSIQNCMFSNIGLDAISTSRNLRLNIVGNRGTSIGAALVYASNASVLNITGNIVRTGATGASPYAVGFDIASSTNVSVTGNVAYECGGAGIGIFASNRVSVSGNVCINNNQDASSVHRGGIVVNTGSSYVTVSGNVCTDSQGTKTQQYGLVIDPTNTNVVVGVDNMFQGNLDGDISSTDYAVNSSIETPVTYVSSYVSTNGTTPGFAPKGTATDIDVQVAPKGAGAFDILTGALEMAGTTVINSSRHPVLRSYAKASLPSAATAAQIIYVTDDVGGATPAFSDGTNWRRVSDRAVIA